MGSRDGSFGMGKGWEKSRESENIEGFHHYHYSLYPGYLWFISL